MKYRKDKSGTQISQLGYGCMRFTRKGAGIDYKKAESEVMLAISKGINYFDTAYIYFGSEECLGRILDENHCRDKVHIQCGDASRMACAAPFQCGDASRIGVQRLRLLALCTFLVFPIFSECSGSVFDF
ncbi:MAG: aldo/keto reductase [Proteobacteria bacterium]|nr:aldo/keto reductase [Pseudomonadota bacterium]